MIFVLKVILAYIAISLFLNFVLFFPLIVQRIKDSISERKKREEEMKKWK